MHLRTLEIKNFRAIGEQGRSLRFEDAFGHIRPITVIAGPNGSGKTSVLTAIVQALRGSLRARIADLPQPCEDDIHRVQTSGRRPVEASVELELYYSNREQTAIRSVFEATKSLRTQSGRTAINPPVLDGGKLQLKWQFPPRLLADGSRASVSELWSLPDYGQKWLNAPSAAWRGWKNRLLSSFTDMYEVGMLNVFPQDRNLLLGSEDDDIDESRDGVERVNGNGPIHTAQTAGQAVAAALEGLGEWAFGRGLAENDDRRKWETTLQDRFDRICAPKKYLGYYRDHARYGETPLLADAGREYPLRSAASGEFVILQYLTRLTFPRPLQNSLILIDEPELHLHPSWIRQLYRALPMMGENNQFILVTHSAELRQLAAEDNALIDLGALDTTLEVIAGV